MAQLHRDDYKITYAQFCAVIFLFFKPFKLRIASLFNDFELMGNLPAVRQGGKRTSISTGFISLAPDKHNSFLIVLTALLSIILLQSSVAFAQTNRVLQQGNKLYDQQRYDEATQTYLKALQKDPNNATGLFNLGNSLYQSKRYDSSRKVMAATANSIKDKGGKAAANYNIGNTYMAQRKWEDAIAAYKNTLRNNPQDADAKYNLSYAEQMMKQDQKNGGGKKDKKDEDKKDQDKKDKKDKGDKDKDKDGKDKKDDKDNKDQENKDKQDKDQKSQGQPSKLSQQQAEQLLNALQQEEKKLQDKMKKEKGIPVKMDKDW